MSAKPISNAGRLSAEALCAWVQSEDDRLFRPLWSEYAPTIAETGSFAAFAGNPDNTEMFWGWVRDNHFVAWRCVTSLLDGFKDPSPPPPAPRRKP